MSGDSPLRSSCHADGRRAGRPRARVRRAERGQALLEFALILPIMLALFGAAVDVARVYQVWNVLESATRDAAEYAATNDTTAEAAATSATRIICTATVSAATCVNPTVTISEFASSLTGRGSSKDHPVVTVTVSASMPFRTLFAYPFITDNGGWTLRSSQTFVIVQGR